jgi:4-azaleucine resistance transporter AzlC
METRLRDGARRSVPIGIAVVAFGVSFGVLARTAGMGVWAPIVMSATTFAGSAQFAAVSILHTGGSVAAAIAAASLLNARYVPISISVARLFRGPILGRTFRSQLIVDESWAVSVRPEGGFDLRLLLGAGLLLYPCWVAGTAVGVVGGGLLGDPRRLGLDAAFPALFLALLAPQVRGRRPLVGAVLGGAIALALVPLAPPGVPIVVASLACLVGWTRP